MRPVKKTLWNNLDGFAILNGISIWDENYKNLLYTRLPGETNQDLKLRIERHQKTGTQATKQGLIDGLSNEFGLDSKNFFLKRKTFTLSYNPYPTDLVEEDIKVFYSLDNQTNWVEVGPQVMPSNYIESKKTKNGFIVWPMDNPVQHSKQFMYSNTIEILEDLPTCFIKIIYYLPIVKDDNTELVLFTDMCSVGDSEDLRFKYIVPEEQILDGNSIVAYTLNDIPEGIKNDFYFDKYTGHPKSKLYDIKSIIDDKHKHQWKDVRSDTCVWDVHKHYGSGVIPSFYDAYDGKENVPTSGFYKSNYTGGIEFYSDSLYMKEVYEEYGSGNPVPNWYPVVFPGKFYINGIPYYYFQNPIVSNISFNSGVATLPSGVDKGAHCILAKSGFYSVVGEDIIPNAYEDYEYFTGEDCQNAYSNIYRRRSNAIPEMGLDISLELGEYKIDYDNMKIYSSGITTATFIHDSTFIYSGVLLKHQLNPIYDHNKTFDNYFLHLTNVENEGI